MVANIASCACRMLHLVSLCFLPAACSLYTSGSDISSRVSESGSIKYVQNISECPCYNHSVSLLHSLNFNKNA